MTGSSFADKFQRENWAFGRGQFNTKNLAKACRDAGLVCFVAKITSDRLSICGLLT